MEDKNKKIFWIIIVIIIITLALIFLRSPEDSWVKDSKGIWIMQGNPTQTSDNVKEQQDAIRCASGIYADANMNDINFSSQCLGSCGNYSIDIVHVPRRSEDDLVENQCEDYRTGKVKHFIELSKNGNIVRID